MGDVIRSEAKNLVYVCTDQLLRLGQDDEREGR